MSTIFFGAPICRASAQQVVQRMSGHASAATTLNVYADLFIWDHKYRESSPSAIVTDSDRGPDSAGSL
jgi:hypothetical protein